MARVRILTVVGARPQFVKLSPVSAALRAEGHDEVVVHTGQHYDYGMSAVFFEELGIAEPDINLAVGSGTHAEQTAGMLVGLEKAIQKRSPDWVLMYGDTNSTLAGALAAAKLHVPVAHVEAGLRSFNRRMPEEINRIVADAVSNVLFAPTAEAVRNLDREGVPADRVHLVGDVMYDAALLHGGRAEQQSPILEKLRLERKQFVLATVHRAENTDDTARIRTIMEALCAVAADMPVVLPLHPRARGALQAQGLLDAASRFLRLTEPVGYLDMVKLEKNAALIATDSGGVQKEAFFHRVPCVTLREETEWVELVELGWNRICPPTSADAIVSAIRAGIGTAGRDGRPYGDGDASRKIARVLGDAQPLGSRNGQNQK